MASFTQGEDLKGLENGGMTKSNIWCKALAITWPKCINDFKEPAINWLQAVISTY